MKKSPVKTPVPYTSLTEYLEDTLAVAHNFLMLYRQFAVTTSPTGSLYHLRGNVVYSNTLDQNAEAPFSAEEIKAHATKREEIISFLSAMHERCKISEFRIPLDELCSYFNLNIFETYAIILALAPEIDSSFARLLAFLQDDFEQKKPSLDFCLKSFTLDSYIQKDLLLIETLERFRLFDFFFTAEESNVSISARRLKLAPRIANFLFGHTELDQSLHLLCQLYFPGSCAFPPLLVQSEIAEKVTDICRTNTDNKVIFLSGHIGSGRKSQLYHICNALNWSLLTVDCRALNSSAARLEQSILQEATLQRAAILFILPDTIENRAELLRAIIPAALNECTLVFFSLDTPLTSQEKNELSAKFLEIHLPVLSSSERELLWQKLLTVFPPDVQGCATELSAKFSFTPGQIVNSIKEATKLADWQGLAVPNRQLLHKSCRSQIQTKLGERALLIPAKYCWDDLILPPAQKDSLRRILNQLQFAKQVYEDWGFAQKSTLGRGLSALLYGPPGTGKTMAAQVLAHELELDLYRIDTSAVMSKYIGETQKNLGSVFDEVSKSQGILFFDEADALFGKRTEIKDVNDRYANADTAFLLQKIECYEGIVLLATNFYQNFDEAFKRRIKFTIEFPIPGQAERLAIWQKAFPPATPLSPELNLDWLAAKFELTGSNIKNIALAAAFLAASEQTKITVVQILIALKEELKKVGRDLATSDLGRYHFLIDKPT